MRKVVGLVAVAATLTVGSADAAHAQKLTGAAKWADSARVLIESSVVGGLPASLDSALVLLDRALSVTPDDYLLLHYKGYALWRQGGTSARNEKKDEATKQLAQADSALERSARLHPMAETFALMASVAGRQTSLDNSRAVTLGLRSNQMEARAMELEPNNPRVALLKGSSAMYGPAEYTGGMPEAVKQFRRARDLFAKESVAAPMPSWGRAENLGFLAMALHASGDDAGAKAAADEALAIAPNYGMVRYKVLPMLKK